MYIYITTEGFLEVFRSSCRKLASVVFESTTTEFRSDTLTDRAMQACVWLALRAKFVQLLQFHQCSDSISTIAFVKDKCWIFTIVYKFTIQGLKITKGIKGWHNNIVLKSEKPNFGNIQKNKMQLD